MTICHQLTSLGTKPLFQLAPVKTGLASVGLLGQDLDDVYHGEPSSVGVLVVDPAGGLAFEKGRLVWHDAFSSVPEMAGGREAGSFGNDREKSKANADSFRE